MNTEDDEIYRTAIAHYGEHAQVLKAIEECGELIESLVCTIGCDYINEVEHLSNILGHARIIIKESKEIDVKDAHISKKIHDGIGDEILNVKFECADVENMLNQLRIMFGPWDDERKMKNERLMERMKNEQANNG